MTANHGMKRHLLAAFLLVAAGLVCIALTGCGSPTASPTPSTTKTTDTKSAQGEEWDKRRTAKDREIDAIDRLIGDRELAEEEKKAELLTHYGFDRGPIATLDRKPIKPNEPELPQVWQKDAGQPALARVSVGDKQTLDLVSLHVSVVIEGPRARTIVDHVYRNPHDRQLEGTFEYPLPSGASPSYFAMFLGPRRDTVPPRFAQRGDNRPLPADALARLTPAELVAHIDSADWGQLQEGRIVAKQKALETYEEIVNRKVDPALLEYAGGNTFRGRVFPIAPHGYNRVILAYEETLPVVRDKMLYRFPLPGVHLAEMEFTLQANSKECLEPAMLPKDLQKEEGGGRIVYSHTWKNEKTEGRILFGCTPADPRVQATSGRAGDNGPHYVYARLRPDLKIVPRSGDRGTTAEQPFASHAVFLLDTSLSEHPGRFAVNMKLMKKILENDRDIQSFNVLAFNVGAAWVEPKGWIANEGAGREKLFSRLDGLVLEGATDLSCAFDKLVSPGWDVTAGTPLNVFLLSDGHITWGESSAVSLAASFERRCPFSARFHCYQTGLGEENEELFQALTRKGGGVFNCFNDADIDAASVAHRNQCFYIDNVRFGDGPAASDVLVSGGRAAVYPGGELVVAAKVQGAGATKIVLQGKFLGKEMMQEFPLTIQNGGELAPRGWAEVAVASLAGLHDPQLDQLVTAYCQQFGVVSRVASFLVLENDNDYKRLKLEEERGRTINGDMALFVAEMWRRFGRETSPRDTFLRLLEQPGLRSRLSNEDAKKLALLLSDKEFELPGSTIRGALLTRADVSPAYLSQREKDRRNVSVYLTEAKRRADDGDADGAVRVLSSVIEEYPAREDALRLVGYRLMDLKQPAQAARLFVQVQRQRPFEPHSYRDLARSLEECGLYGLAAVQYEIVLAGRWDTRFAASLQTVVREEYAQMMQDALRRNAVAGEVAQHFRERLAKLNDRQTTSDLRVTLSWNTDATDVDLWVIEPDGTKVFYQNKRSRSGGELSEDQTQGYGPERYQVAKALAGEYKIVVHYFAANRNLLGGETHVNVVVRRKAGTPDETIERHTVILKRQGDEVTVCKVKF
jgi:hypothetical protein